MSSVASTPGGAPTSRKPGEMGCLSCFSQIDGPRASPESAVWPQQWVVGTARRPQAHQVGGRSPSGPLSHVDGRRALRAAGWSARRGHNRCVFPKERRRRGERWQVVESEVSRDGDSRSGTG